MKTALLRAAIPLLRAEERELDREFERKQREDDRELEGKHHEAEAMEARQRRARGLGELRVQRRMSIVMCVVFLAVSAGLFADWRYMNPHHSADPFYGVLALLLPVTFLIVHFRRRAEWSRVKAQAEAPPPSSTGPVLTDLYKWELVTPGTSRPGRYRGWR